jgi:hypothetical protein
MLSLLPSMICFPLVFFVMVIIHVTIWLQQVNCKFHRSVAGFCKANCSGMLPVVLASLPIFSLFCRLFRVEF